MLGNLIIGFLAIVIGTSLVPSVADSVSDALTNASGDTINNFSGASDTILGLTTLFYVLAVAASGIAVAAQGLRASGLV